MKNNLIFTVLALSVVSTGLAMEKEGKKDESKQTSASSSAAAIADSVAASIAVAQNNPSVVTQQAVGFGLTPAVRGMSDEEKAALLKKVFDFSKGKFPG